MESIFIHLNKSTKRFTAQGISVLYILYDSQKPNINFSLYSIKLLV